jgi:hypothetical protein
MRTLALLGLAAAAAAVLPSHVLAQDGCRNVRFSLINRHESNRAIRIDQVQYFNTVNNRVQTENVPNLVCAPRATCITRGDTLRDSENVALDRIQFVYRVRDADDRGWGPRIPSRPNVPADRRCRAERTYGPFELNR